MKVYFNNSCKICRTEINMYKKENIEDIDYLCVGINHMAFYQKFEKKITDNQIEDLYPKLKNLANKIVNDEILSSRSLEKSEYSNKILHEKV